MIQIDKLNFGYDKKNPLFVDLDLSLAPGKIYGLLGKNGTGKSSLLKLMNGHIFPDNGSIDIDTFSPGDRNPIFLSDLYYLPEELLYPSVSIRDYVKAFGPFYPHFSEPQFYELLELFEVDSSAKLDGLSYGQRKKVLISFGVATNAKYLLLDEPTNGLDIPSKSQFRKVLLKGFKEHQTIIISTHQIRDLNQLIESLIILEKGQILFNQDVINLENKLLFEKKLSDTPDANTIYVEGVTGSYVHIKHNNTQVPSEVELEGLFNAIIKDSYSINKLFN